MMTKQARDVDIKYNGWVPTSGTPDPVQQRLQSFGRVDGLVVGAHGEFSEDLMRLVKRLVKQGAQSRFLEMGFDSPSDARSTISRQVFMALGIEATRGMARLRIDSLGIALAGTASNNAASMRRRASKATFEQYRDAYQTRHAFYDV